MPGRGAKALCHVTIVPSQDLNPTIAMAVVSFLVETLLKHFGGNIEWAHMWEGQ